eukprot:jgi/Picre1/35555/NNA_003016.t1
MGIIETELSRDLPTALRIGEAVLTDVGLAALSADGAKICHASFGNMNGGCVPVGDGGIKEVKAGCGGTLVTRTSTECVESKVAIAVESGEGLFVLQFDKLKQSELVRLEASPGYYDGVRMQPSLQWKSSIFTFWRWKSLWETNFPRTDGVEFKVHPWFESEAERVLAVFAISKDSTHVYLVDTYSGHLVEDYAEIKSNGSPLNVVPVEPMAKNHGEQHVFALVDISDNVIDVAPMNDPSAKQHFETKSQSMVKWGVSQDKKSVYGVRLTSSGPSPVLWKFRAAATDNVKILDISSRDKSEAIYSAENQYMEEAYSSRM